MTAHASTGATIGAENIAHPSRSTDQRWYAAYTCAQHEKRVAEQLAEREVAHFLPLYSSVRRWKDRRVRLALPLFPGYVFVRMVLQSRMRVLEIPGVVRLVGFGGIPTVLPEEEIEVLRSSLTDELHAEPHAFLTVGRRVRIVRGPLAGLEGILQRKKNNFRLVVSVKVIQRSFAVNVDAADVQPVQVPDKTDIRRPRHLNEHDNAPRGRVSLPMARVHEG
jgi:transcription antitermination factor NusG